MTPTPWQKRGISVVGPHGEPVVTCCTVEEIKLASQHLPLIVTAVNERDVLRVHLWRLVAAIKCGLDDAAERAAAAERVLRGGK